MQTPRSAIVPLLLMYCALTSQAAVKIHTVALGAARKVPYSPPEATLEAELRKP